METSFYLDLYFVFSNVYSLLHIAKEITCFMVTYLVFAPVVKMKPLLFGLCSRERKREKE